MTQHHSSEDEDDEVPIFRASTLETIKFLDDHHDDDAVDKMDYEDEDKDKVTEDKMDVTQMDKDTPNEHVESSSDLEEEDKSAGGRYFIGGTGGPKCFNCGQPGHISKDCTESTSAPCFLCGGRGHQRSSCPEEVCYNCNRVGHMSRDCPQPRKRRAHEGDYCNRCQMPGHLQKDCSLNWRRYTFAREPTRAEVGRADGLLAPFCYNCASDRHWGDECRNRRRPDHTIFHRPELEFLKLTVLHQEDERVKSSPQYRGSSSRFDMQRSSGRDEYQKSSYNRQGHDRSTLRQAHHRPSSSEDSRQRPGSVNRRGDGFNGSDRPVTRDADPFGSTNRGRSGISNSRGGNRNSRGRQEQGHQDNNYNNRPDEAHPPRRHYESGGGTGPSRGRGGYAGSYRKPERQA